MQSGPGFFDHPVDPQAGAVIAVFAAELSSAENPPKKSLAGGIRDML